MARHTAFVKVSGDLCEHEECLAVLGELGRQYFVTVCVGGGTQINEALVAAGYDHATHGPLGREAQSFRERQIARDVLEENQMRLQDELADSGVPVDAVTIPVLDIATVLCHVNGDQMVRTAYLGYDQLYVLTTPERYEVKRAQFADLPRVTIVALGDGRQGA